LYIYVLCYTVAEFDSENEKSDDNNENLIVNESIARMVNKDVKKGKKVKDKKNKEKHKKNGRKKRPTKGKTDMDNEETEESVLEGI
jgi:hypothetical protein